MTVVTSMKGRHKTNSLVFQTHQRDKIVPDRLVVDTEDMHTHRDDHLVDARRGTRHRMTRHLRPFLGFDDNNNNNKLQ